MLELALPVGPVVLGMGQVVEGSTFAVPAAASGVGEDQDLVLPC